MGLFVGADGDDILTNAIETFFIEIFFCEVGEGVFVELCFEEFQG